MLSLKKIKDKETALMSSLLLLFLLSLFSGYATYFYHGSYLLWKQWMYLLHTLFSLGFCLVFPLYLINHFKRVMVFRRAFVSFLGIVLSLLLIALCLSGLWIIYFGQQEAERWIYDNHIVLSYWVILLILLHLLFPFFFKESRSTKGATKNKRRSFAEYFSTIEKKALQKTAIALIMLPLVLVILSFLYGLLPSPFIDKARVQPYQDTFGAHPFRPSHTETTSGTFIDAKRIGNSVKCGSCHQQIFAEWQASAHRQAASDPAYVKNVNLLEKEKGIAATRFCEGCHAPVALLSGQLSEGGKHGGVAGTLANSEGVGCMGCHGIVQAVHQKGNASYLFEGESPYLFDSYEHPLAQKINHFLLRLHPQEHVTQLTPAIEKQALLCATCHESFMDKEMNNWGWLKMQTDYSTWLNSHYSGSHDQTFAQSVSGGKGNKKRCQDCHMPLVDSVDPSANSQQQAFSHRSLGANTVLPWLNNDTVQLEKTVQFLQSAKMMIAIETPSRNDLPQTALFIDEGLRAKQDIPYFLYLGEQGALTIVVSNRRVGHDFPGGTRDINQAWVHLLVKDAENQVLYESGSLNEKHEVDKTARFYHTVPVNKNGQHVWKHNLFHMTGYTYKNAIPAGKSDVVNYTFDVPFDVKSPLTVIATLRYRKFNQAYARWALDNDAIELPIVDLAQDVQTILVKEKKSAMPIK